jgi:hypothetical protein
MFTNASPDRMCGLYMTYDAEEEYGDNWLPEDGVASGASTTFKVKPGKYKARWDTCKSGKNQPYYAATLWRETGVVLDKQTQLYAFVADAVSPTKRAQTMSRDYHVVKFPGQAVELNPKQQPPLVPQVAMRVSDEPPPIAGFVGLVVLDAEMVAQRDHMAPAEK